MARPFFGAKQALMDFRELYGIDEPMWDIDGAGAYFQKTKAPKRRARRDLYRMALKKKNYTHALVPKPPLSTGDYHRAWKSWEAAADAATDPWTVRERDLAREKRKDDDRRR